MASVHEYPVTVQWSGGKDGSGSVRTESGHVSQDLAVPTEFGGPGGATNPEELLTSAITSCYSITFGIIAANRKLPVASFECAAVGEVEQSGAQFTYKAITLRPRILLEAGSSDEQAAMAEDMAHKADSYCIVTNAVRGKVEIRVEPSVSKA